MAKLDASSHLARLHVADHAPNAHSSVRRQSALSESPGLRPFFGFYGGKWRDAIKYYPRPLGSTIIEPFAGSAGYALRYYGLKIRLYEIDPILAGVWTYLIRAKPREILRIPDLSLDQTVDDLKVCEEAKWLVGFWLNRGVAAPRKSASQWMRAGIRPGSFWGERVRTTIASQVDRIRHWKVRNASYETAFDFKNATWFIDPPYQGAGAHYRYGSKTINYGSLADWCRSREGLVIVCENAGAEWLPFVPLAQTKTTRADTRSKEVVWIRSPPEEK